MRVYLAGPMTGMAKWNVAGFRSAAAYARRQSWTPVSPEDSRGAKAEWEHASRSGMTIHYLPTEREN
jgi:hypothetical protein